VLKFHSGLAAAINCCYQLGKWEAEARKKEEAKERNNNGKTIVGTGRFELPTPRTPSGSEGSESK